MQQAAKKKARLSPAKRAAMKRRFQNPEAGDGPDADPVPTTAVNGRGPERLAKAAKALDAPNASRPPEDLPLVAAPHSAKSVNSSAGAAPPPAAAPARKAPQASHTKGKARSSSAPPSRLPDEAPTPASASAPAAVSSEPSAAMSIGWKASVGPCNVCGGMGHLGRTCPARECRECGGSGHIAKHCPARLGGSQRVEGSAESAGAPATADVGWQAPHGTPSVAAGASPMCSHCGGSGHAAGRCTFGWRAGEEHLLCGSAGCFTRHFILPLRQAKTDFDETEPRHDRMDVATSCLSAALSRSQSLRGNASMTLCFKEQRVQMQARAPSPTPKPRPPPGLRHM